MKPLFSYNMLSILRLWPILAVVFFVWTIWITLPRVGTLVSWELTRKNTSQMLAEEQVLVTKLAKMVKLPDESPQKLAAREELAAIYLGQHRIDAANVIYQDVLKIKTAHKQDLTSTSLHLAETLRSAGDFNGAEHYYKLIWDYDKAHLNKTDPLLIRDLNNLGVIYYLIALSTENKLERELELNRSNFFLLQAQIAAGNETSAVNRQDEANIWENRSLVLREMGNSEQAKILGSQARSIHQAVSHRLNPP